MVADVTAHLADYLDVGRHKLQVLASERLSRIPWGQLSPLLDGTALFSAEELAILQRICKTAIASTVDSDVSSQSAEAEPADVQSVPARCALHDGKDCRVAACNTLARTTATVAATVARPTLAAPAEVAPTEASPPVAQDEYGIKCRYSSKSASKQL